MTDTPTDILSRETPPWFDAAKLGLFVHWNPAAIPAYAPNVRAIRDQLYLDDPTGAKRWRRLPYAEMYQAPLSIPGSATARHHAEQYGDMPYDRFVERFRDELIPGWHPEPIADLAASTGAQYVVLYTKMEDGFLPWPSAHPNPHKEGWHSHRDVIGELAAHVRSRGLRFGVAYSGGMDWTFGGLPITGSASRAAAMIQTPEYRQYVEAHWRELIDRYEPCSLWNDYTFPAGADLEGLFRYYLERVPDGVINDRFDRPRQTTGELYCDFVTPEYSVEGSPERKWEACRGIGISFGYNRQEDDSTYISATDLIHTFVDIVARGGNLLINLAPTATGEIPWAQAQRLLALGWWMRINGEAIYGTRPWQRIAGITLEGFDVRYTTSREEVHAIVLGRPRTAAVEIDVRLDEGAVAQLHGRTGGLPWTSSPAGTRIDLPEIPDDRPTVTLRLGPASAVHPFDECE